MLFLIFSLISTLFILCINCQYGQPWVSGKGQFSYECRQTELDVISLPNSRDYEVIASKPFQYSCDFFVDTRDCPHNPQSSGCDGIEIVWILPEKLTQLEQQKVITRKTENTVIERQDGYDIYRTTLGLNDVGFIHEGQYSWKFNLKFEMKTVFEDSFKITTIDMLQRGEPCTYDDLCLSNKCLDSQCVSGEPRQFPWVIVTIVATIAVVLILAIVLIVIYVKNKEQKYLNIRRF